MSFNSCIVLEPQSHPNFWNISVTHKVSLFPQANSLLIPVSGSHWSVFRQNSSAIFSFSGFLFFLEYSINEIILHSCIWLFSLGTMLLRSIHIVASSSLVVSFYWGVVFCGLNVIQFVYPFTLFMFIWVFSSFWLL